MNQNMHSFRKIIHPQFPCILATILLTLGWNCVAFCDDAADINTAAWKGDLAKVKELLIAKPDLISSTEPPRQFTPLHIAAWNGRKEIVEFLLANGADVNAKGGEGETPLGMAVACGKIDVAKILHQHGGQGVAPIHYAAATGDLEAVKTLLKAHPEQASYKEGKFGMAPLHFSAQAGKKDLVEFLLANGADINDAKTECGTPLGWAAANGHKEVVEVLLAHKADPNIYGGEHWAPLLLAAKAGHAEVVKLLLANNADINAEHFTGKTSLHFAAEKGFAEVARVLLNSHANVNAKDQDGATPLTLAEQKSKQDVARLLTETLASPLTAAYKQYISEAVGALRRYRSGSLGDNSKESRSQPIREALSNLVKVETCSQLCASLDLVEKAATAEGSHHFLELDVLTVVAALKDPTKDLRDPNAFVVKGGEGQQQCKKRGKPIEAAPAPLSASWFP